MSTQFRNRTVDVSHFSMIPRADIPRSVFNSQHMLKTTFDAAYLVPIYVDEVLPGDSFKVRMTAFCRLATPIFPIMDNLYLDTFFFYVPNRLLWSNWVKMMGEQDNPGDSISFSVPQVVSTAGGYAVNSLFDYMGLPTAGQVLGGGSYTHSALPLRAYNRIWNEWFRDENLQNKVTSSVGDGPDTPATFTLLKRGKRHDYFTGCLPWPQKATSSVTVGISGLAPVIGIGSSQNNIPAGAPPFGTYETGNVNPRSYAKARFLGLGTGVATTDTTVIEVDAATGLPKIFADLSQATAQTINQLRQSFQIQRLLERDARGGTRYTEIVRSHFGVTSPDMRLQRPEFLGGGSTRINIAPVSQQSGTGATGTTSALGDQGGIGTGVAHGHGFSQSFTEHGIVLGLASVRADMTYQQGLHKMWARKTRYDFYWPVFAHLGEQAVYMNEIYCDGVNPGDTEVFGYQERWAEYRHKPSRVTGLFRSTSAGTLDSWHLAQRFTSKPTLSATFIEENPPVSRVVAVGAASLGKQFLFDSFFDIRMVRAMPTFSVPGLIDHF